MAVRQKKIIKKTGTLKKLRKTKHTKTAPSVPATITSSKALNMNRDFYIVGIGASAGGLEAFQEFFTHMPSNSGIAFVLVPHLDPTHKSIIGDILRKYTNMKIFQAEDGMKVLPNCVYLIQPDKNLAILNGSLQLIEPPERRGLRHPIDFFFRTLAEDQGEHAIAVILSGTGTEGALGLKAIKSEGGLVIVQDPITSKYDGMPRSAIATDMVDYIVPAENIPETLLKYSRLPHTKILKKHESPTGKLPDAMQKIFILVRNQTGHDFSHYKPNTIIRRIEKRMTLHQIENVAHYVTYLRDNPSEVNILFKELLIRVTRFFRDPEAFEMLRKDILPDLFKRAGEEYPFRVWVPGCSSGEEAYSIAIALHEYISEHNPAGKIQIFATDIDSGAIETARNGIYPDSISTDVSQQRLKRYFTREDNSFRISSKIRELVVFAVQNVTKDPPFSKVDIISCRNLLIYLGPELQKKLIPLFHYALKPGGILFLGTSETIGTFSDLFTAVNNKWKIFKPKKSSLVSTASLDYYPTETKTAPMKLQSSQKEITGEITLGEMTEKLLIERYAPPCVIIDKDGSILYFHGRKGLIMVVFEETAPSQRTKADKKLPHIEKQGSRRAAELEFELRSMREQLQSTIEELEASNEELQSTNEELQSANEELQSSNEELETSKEELQSVNEELMTVNAESQN